MRTDLNHQAKAFVLFFMLFWLTADCFAEASMVNQEVYDVNVVVEFAPGELASPAQCKIRVKGLSNRSIQHLDAGVTEIQTLKLAEGAYQANAVVKDGGPITHAGIAYFNVPGPNTVKIAVEKVKKRKLYVKVENEQGIAVSGCAVRLSFLGNIEFRAIPRFVDASGTRKTEVTDSNGVAAFEFVGPLPDFEFHVLGQSLVLAHKTKVEPSEWGQDGRFVLKVLPKLFNGKIECYIQKHGKKYPFAEGLRQFAQGQPQHMVGRLIKAEYDLHEKRHFNFRFEDDCLALYGLPDADYYIRRVEISWRDAEILLFRLRNQPVTVKDGKLVAQDSTVVLAEDSERKFPVEITVTDGRKPVASVSVFVRGPLGGGRGVTNQEGGLCGVTLAEGKYEVETQHRMYATGSRQVYIDPNNALVEIELRKLAVVRGTIACQGEPVTDQQVIALFDVMSHQYVGQTDANGHYEIPVKESGYFVLGVYYDGFGECKQAWLKDKRSMVVNVDLTPRQPIQVRLGEKAKELISDKAALLLLDEETGAPSCNYMMTESGVAEGSALDGSYDAYLYIGENTVYCLGMVQIRPGENRVIVELPGKARPMDSDAYKKRMHAEFKKGELTFRQRAAEKQ